MITSATERFTCSVYPEPQKMTLGALNFAYNRTAEIVKRDSDNPMFKCGFAKSDYVEAMAMLILESQYRWENLGGKEKHAAIFKN